MTTSWVLTFIEAHPVASFFMMWPVGLTLISLAWQFATTIESGMNLVLRLVSIASNTFVLTVRGYAPQSLEAEEIEKEKDES